jgi:hypothetical protein
VKSDDEWREFRIHNRSKNKTPAVFGNALPYLIVKGLTDGAGARETDFSNGEGEVLTPQYVAGL